MVTDERRSHRLTFSWELPSVSSMRSVASVALAAGLLLGLVVGLGAPADAAEDELIMAVEPSYALLDRDDQLGHGAGLAFAAWIGTESPFWLAVSAGFTGHVETDDPLTGELLLGITYALDVFATIPFLEAQGGLITGRGGAQPTARFGLGVDHLITRTVSLGVVARYRPTAEPLGNALITAHIRLAVRLEL